MNYLLDTHAFLWFVTNDPGLGAAARQAMTAGANRIHLSVASLWEIAIKVGIGKLALKDRYDIYIPREVARNGFILLPITLDHAAVVATLPHHHRDPFDRMLIAQAMAEGMPILGADPAFDAYGITRLW